MGVPLANGLASRCVAFEQNVVSSPLTDRLLFLGLDQGAPVGPNPNDPTTAVQPKELFTTKGTLEPSTTIIGRSQGLRVPSLTLFLFARLTPLVKSTGTDSKIEDEVLVLNVICLPHKDITGDCKNQIIL